MRTVSQSIAISALLALVAANARGAPPDRSKPPEAGTPKPFTITQPTVFTLKHGLTVWHVARKRAPLVDVHAVIDAGPLFDPADRPGLAKWTADLLTEGSALLADVLSAHGFKPQEVREDKVEGRPAATTRFARRGRAAGFPG